MMEGSALLIDERLLPAGPWGFVCRAGTYASLFHRPSILMAESLMPFAAAVVAAPLMKLYPVWSLPAFQGPL